MSSPFKISFRREIPDLKKEEIIDLFLINLRETLYQKVEKENGTKVTIKGEYFSFDPGKYVAWNLWTGFSGKAELYFPEENIIAYSVDFTYGTISLSTGLLFLILIGFLSSFPIWLLTIVFSISVFLFVMKILLHLHFFSKTIRLKNRYKGNYDWSELLKNKSDIDLNKIANGHSFLTEEVQNLAKAELTRRRKPG